MPEPTSKGGGGGSGEGGGGEVAQWVKDSVPAAEPDSLSIPGPIRGKAMESRHPLSKVIL